LRAQARAATSAGAATADEALTLLAEIGPCGILDVPLRIAAAAALLRAGRAEAASSAARAARARLEHQASRAPSAAARDAFSSLPEHADLRDIERELAAPEASDVRA
jgi:hypothetical protein